jgi:F-type H+-transporting ATPase subunit gamma
MPSLIDLRRRVRAMKNTQQITKAMKMVAASKLRRAQERIVGARPYAAQMQRVLRSVAERVDPSVHPLLTVRDRGPNSRTLVLVVTGDKGLCGSFNTNTIKAAGTFVVESREPCVLGLVGRRGRDFFRRRRFEALFERIGIADKPSFAHAQDVGSLAVDAFTSGQVDRVMLVYNEFRSVMSQRVVVDQLLPIARADVEGPPAAESGRVDYLYEPAPQEILNQLLPRYIEVQIYRALLESNAAFFAAQMTAMDTATRNATDMIATMTLFMNKVRQAAITREIIEVVSGAQGL